MKIVSYEGPHGVRAGVLRESPSGDVEVVDLASAGLPASVKQALYRWDELHSEIRQAAKSGPAVRGEARLRAPIQAPQKVVCVGLNYADHATETGAAVGDEPVIFCKFPTALRGPDDAIVLPRESKKVDYEAELVVVIGKPATRVDRCDAMQHVAGYCCGNDVSARDWQKGKPGGQWLLGKSFDSFAPLGPWMTTADDVPDPGQLPIRLRLNGRVMQDSNTNQLIFPIDYLVSYLSHVCTLLPGDLIYTGTPPGVGAACKPPIYLQSGDQVEVDIEGLGVLKNRVVDYDDRAT